MILYFVRHGYPDYEHDSLTEEGRRQAEETAKYLNSIDFNYIFSSILERAVATAEYLAKKQNKDIIKLAWASEHNAGSYFAVFDEEHHFSNWLFWDKKCAKRMLELSEDKEWYKDPLFVNNNIEYALNFYVKEIGDWLKSLGIYHDHKTKTFHKIEGMEVPENVVLFAHGGMAMCFLSNILDINYPYFSTHFNVLDTCGVVKIEIDLDNQVARLASYNEIHY